MFKLFLQDSPNDCGVACLASVLNHYGHFVTPVDLASEMNFSRGGTSSLDLQDAAERHGLESRLIQLTVEEFDHLPGPCIAYVPGEVEDSVHNVVVTRVKGQRLWIADPARGTTTLSRNAFARNYEGQMLILRPSPGFQKGRFSRSYLARFLTFAADYRGAMFKALGLGLVTSLLGFALIYLSKYFVDDVLPVGDMEMVFSFALVFFLARLLNVAASGLGDVYRVILRNGVTGQLSKRYFDHSLRLEKKHVDSRDQGDFLQQIPEIEGLGEGVTHYFANFVLVVLGIAIKAGFLIWLYDPLLVSIILGILVLNAALGFLLTRVTIEDTNRRISIFAQVNSLLMNSLSDIRVVRVFAAQAWILDRFRNLLQQGLHLVKRLAGVQIFGRAGADLLSAVSEAAIFLICGKAILDGDYGLGDFLIFMAFAQGLAAESLQFPELIVSFGSHLRSFARVQAIMGQSLESGGTLEADAGGLKIEFRDVSFSYMTGVPILRNLSFTIEANQTCAFVGESGSGKTTIMNLIMGFYKPQSGVILVNGTDLNKLDLQAYRKRISAVFQDTTLYHGNTLENVVLGSPEITLDKVRQVAAVLGVGNFVEALPLGWQQPLYPGALSGGQMQQIAILRALCRPFDLLILDEATSHLDSVTEERIVSGSLKLASGCGTRAVIAHRLSTVMGAGQIIVMKGGRAVERGRHGELMAHKGTYRQLIERQYEVNLVPPANGG